MSWNKQPEEMLGTEGACLHISGSRHVHVLYDSLFFAFLTM